MNDKNPEKHLKFIKSSPKFSTGELRKRIPIMEINQNPFIKINILDLVQEIT